MTPSFSPTWGPARGPSTHLPCPPTQGFAGNATPMFITIDQICLLWTALKGSSALSFQMFVKLAAVQVFPLNGQIASVDLFSLLNIIAR